MELFVICCVGVVVGFLLLREFGGKSNAACGIISHDVESDGSADRPSYDWVTDPCCSYLPGNIYYQNGSTTSSCSCSGSDWMTDPCCSYMPGNIYHDAHFGSSSSSLSNDDAWSSSSMSSFGDSWSSSSSSFRDD